MAIMSKLYNKYEAIKKEKKIKEQQDYEILLDSLPRLERMYEKLKHWHISEGHFFDTLTDCIQLTNQPLRIGDACVFKNTSLPYEIYCLLLAHPPTRIDYTIKDILLPYEIYCTEIIIRKILLENRIKDFTRHDDYKQYIDMEKLENDIRKYLIRIPKQSKD